MDTLSHFTLALLAGMAVGLHRKHRLRYVIFISLLSVLIDLDHFLVPMGYSTEYRSMHSIWIAVLIPLLLFTAAHILERKSGKDGWQTFFLLMMIMLTGHLVTDMIGGPVKIFYPVSEKQISLPKVNVQATDRFTSTIANNTGLGIAIYACIIFSGAIVHDVIWHSKRDKKGSRDALKRTFQDYF
jgi:lysylphosphatidylglycerol synthetase-like protein (DUF2156 family)